VAIAAATPTALKKGVIAVLPALGGHDYSDADTNVLIRELSTGIGSMPGNLGHEARA
jgi:hypothetical protein